MRQVSSPWCHCLTRVLVSGACALILALLLSACRRASEPPARSTRDPGRHALSPDLAEQVAQIESREGQLDQTVWAKEMAAERYGHVFEAFWDAVNGASNKLGVLGAFPVGQIRLGNWVQTNALRNGIEQLESRSTVENGSRRGDEADLGLETKPQAPPPHVGGYEKRDFQTPAQAGGELLDQRAWSALVARYAKAGWQLNTLELRQVQFDPATDGKAAESRFAFSAHLTNPATPERAQFTGTLVVTWTDLSSPPISRGGPAPEPATPTIQRIDARELQLLTQRGEAAFQPVLVEHLSPRHNTRSIDPLLVYDLDGDGYAEIILAAQNVLYRRRASDGAYQAEPLCRYPPDVVYTGLVGDFDGDGTPDFLCETYQGLVLFSGSPKGTFDEPGRLVWRADRTVQYPMALTCGDVDEDGDLDLFLVQYRLPYEGGQMATPYDDANDGYPSFLLLNNGHGQFTDGTSAAGLGQKRWRRGYSASLVDLDGDGHLDLVVASDFAGVDVYQNDGHGRFTDRTRQWLPESHAFGMSQIVGDFNSDGILDLLLIGMPSPTADRLEHLNLWRPDAVEEHSLRSRMTHGNRLFVGRPNGGFEISSLDHSIARAGWAWGCGVLDVDNDGWPDVYIANGMESRSSVRDYEGQFWLHDAYVANSQENPAAYGYLKAKVDRRKAEGVSYGGYEKNRFYWNQGGRSFLEVGHLFGLALEEDSRNVVAADLDGDGRVDVVVTSFDPWPQSTQTLRVFRNLLPETGNWIGFRFREDGQGASPVGVRVTVDAGGRKSVQALVAGDAHRSQRPNTLHFGLGRASHADRVEIRWPRGLVQVLTNLPAGRYYPVQGSPR